MDVDKLKSKESAEVLSSQCSSSDSSSDQEEGSCQPRLQRSSPSPPSSPVSASTTLTNSTNDKGDTTTFSTTLADSTNDKGDTTTFSIALTDSAKVDKSATNFRTEEQQTVVSGGSNSNHSSGNGLQSVDADTNESLSPSVDIKGSSSTTPPHTPKGKPLSPSESIKLHQSLIDTQQLVDFLSRSLSGEPSSVQAQDTCKMVQGNGFVVGPYGKPGANAENLACYLGVSPGLKNERGAALPPVHSLGLHLKYPASLLKKENALHQDYCCENRTSDSNNSDEEDCVEIGDENEDWSFDEEEEEVTSGKQCACVFKHSPNENGTKTPLQHQNSNPDSGCTSPSPLHGNTFCPASHALQCPDCEQTFNCRVDLNRHRLKHITEKSFKCSHCDKSFAFSFNLKSHERQHTGEKPYVCNECGLRFVHAFNFHEHRRVHKNRDHFVCNICLKWFSMESKYLLHIRKHSSIKPFKCSVCGKAFNRAAGLRAHELLHSSGKEDQWYMCRFCDRTFVRLSNKQMHERVHFSEKLFPCTQCGITFTELAHVRTHCCVALASTPRYPCGVCKEAFLSPQQLECHSRLHTPKKSSTKNAHQPETKFNLFKRRAPVGSTKRRFPCKLCCQAFSTKRLLDDHAKIHQREKTPFMCKVCSLTFTHSNYLKLHMTTHDKDVSIPAFGNTLETKVVPKNLSPGFESPSSSSGRSRQSSGEHSICHSPLNPLPPVSIKTEPE